MDHIFDNLLYIVIALVTFGISALGKKKKKQGAIRRPTQNLVNKEKQSGLGFNLEKLIKEELGLEDQNEQAYQTQTAEESVVEAIEKPLDFVPEYMLDDKEDVPYSVEYDDSVEIKNEISDSDITKDLQEEETLLDDFNLQEAIIYSEIINRKEY